MAKLYLSAAPSSNGSHKLLECSSAQARLTTFVRCCSMAGRSGDVEHSVIAAMMQQYQDKAAGTEAAAAGQEFQYFIKVT